MSSKSFVLPAVFLLAACSASASSDDGSSTNALGAAPAKDIAFITWANPVVGACPASGCFTGRLDADFAATSAAASALLPKLESDLANVEMAECQQALKTTKAFARHFGFGTSVTKEEAGYVAHVMVDSTLCSTNDTSAIDVVLVRQSDIDAGHIATLSGLPPKKGVPLLLLADLAGVGAGTCAAVPETNPDEHGCFAGRGELDVRFTSGAFQSFTAVSSDVGQSIFRNGPSYVPALAIELTPPSDADRIEVYMRFDRWPWHFTGDVSAEWDAELPQAYVSNFGKNFSLEIH